MTDCPDFVFTPLFSVAAVGAPLLACAGLLLWARRLVQPDRVAVLLSAGAVGLVVATLNLVLGTTGVWQACTYRLPLLVLATLYLLGPSVLAALLLLGYRWLGRHLQHPALVYGALVLGLLAPLIVLADERAIASGYIAFGGGYTVWMDTTVGVALFWLPVLLYRGLRMRGPSA